jgi:tRNA pseudouridine65 synthase
VNGPPESTWAALPLGRGVALLVHDANGVAALAKPAGILSHPNAAGEESRALLNAAYRIDGEFYQWAAHRLWLLNRLDSATSGVILVAADAALAETVRAQFKRKQVGKVYHALVFGTPKKAAELWQDRVAVQKRGERIRTVGGNIPAESRMSVVRSGRPVSLLRLEPQTGRSHQLRVQCASRGLPIVGDQTYGNFRLNREFARTTGIKRMFLHSLETSFEYEFEGKSFRFSAKAPLPAEFNTI